MSSAGTTSHGLLVRSLVMLTPLDVQGLSDQTGPITRYLHVRTVSLTVTVTLTVRGCPGKVSQRAPLSEYLWPSLVVLGQSAKGFPHLTVPGQPGTVRVSVTTLPCVAFGWLAPGQPGIVRDTVTAMVDHWQYAPALDIPQPVKMSGQT